MDDTKELLAAGVRHLLADFEEAFRVYERLSANAERRAGREPAPPVKIEAVTWPAGGGMLVLADGRALVLECAVEGDDLPREALGRLERAGAADGHGAAEGAGAADGAGADSPTSGAVAPGARVYAIVVTSSWELAATDPAFDALGELCTRCGLVWSGGLAVGGGALVAAQAGEARMGRRRRARSEGIDLVIAAVRSNAGVDELPGVDGDIVDAPCSVPRFLYRHQSFGDRHQ